MDSAVPQAPSPAVPTELVVELRVVTQLPARGVGTNLPELVSAWKMGDTEPHPCLN